MRLHRWWRRSALSTSEPRLSLRTHVPSAAQLDQHSHLEFQATGTRTASVVFTEGCDVWGGYT